MARRESVDFDALSCDERFHLTGKPHGTVLSLAHIQTVHACRVAGSIGLASLLVDDGKGEVTVEVLRYVIADLVVQVHDHLAIRVRSEDGRVLDDIPLKV